MTKLDREIVIFLVLCMIVCGLIMYKVNHTPDSIPSEETNAEVEPEEEFKVEVPKYEPVVKTLEYTKEEETWTEDDVFCLACVAYQEAGSRYHSNLTRRYVIDVVLNRVNDSRFPNTIRGVLEDAPNGAMQYGLFSVTGVQMLKKWSTEEERRQEEELFMLCWVDAENALRGDHTEIYGDGYVWQAEFSQGVNGFWQDGIFFGKG